MNYRNDFYTHSLFYLLGLLLLSACGGGDKINDSIDVGFSTSSRFIGFVLSIAPADDGSGDLYAGGSFTTYNGTGINGIARVNSDGSLDTGFDTGSGFNSTVFSITLANDGSGDIYVWGSFTGYNGSVINGIARINSDGSLDTAFAIGSGFDSTVENIAPVTDGSGDLYAGGSFTTYNGTTTNRIARLNSDGSLDTGFDTGSGFDYAVNSIALANDGSGDLYVGGGFTVYNGTTTNRIARVNSDGSLDIGFDTGSGFDGSVFSIAPAIDASGNVYIGGQFSSYDTLIVGDIVRLDSGGSLD